MITYAGEGAVLDQHLLGGFPLHIGMLNTEQTRRSEQPCGLGDHHPDHLQPVIAGEQGEQRIVITCRPSLSSSGPSVDERPVRTVNARPIRFTEASAGPVGDVAAGAADRRSGVRGVLVRPQLGRQHLERVVRVGVLPHTPTLIP